MPVLGFLLGFPLVIGAVIAISMLLHVGEVFCISIRDGKVRVVRGTVPVSMLQAVGEAVVDPTVVRATIRAFKDDAGARLDFKGDIPAGREQRIRNTFMLYPAAQLRSRRSE